ncbi:hypothetical protein ACVWWG_007319 [Bradyrhizobium sp. LB7.2]
MQTPRRLHLLQVALELGDALLDQAAVGFDLRLAGTAHESKAAALALEMGPGADETRALVVEMRELDLERAFLGLGAAAEDLQNEARAVEHLGLQFLLEIALLDRCQRAIHHHELDIEALDQPGHLLDLALADVSRGPDLVDRRDDGVGNDEIDGAREAGGFIEPGLGVTQDMAFRLRVGTTRAHPQVGADDKHPPRLLGPCRPRTVGIPVEIPGFQSDHSQAGSSPPSNNWIGAPGMMVEIACL